jgi:hypothetical protein
MTDDGGHLPQPWCRATIADGTITLNPWTPYLIRSGPQAMVLERLDGVVLADLFTEGEPGEEELTVRYVCRSPRSGQAEDALIAWAATVGYRRIWLPTRVMDLDPAACELGVAATRCPTCHLEWRDETADFWGGVRAAGAFPGYCLACGGSLPEWRVVAGSEATDREGRDRALGAFSDVS